MSVKHVTDLMVCRVFRDEELHERELTLVTMSGEPFKVVTRAMERAHRHGLIEYGVSLRSGWLTELGKALLRANLP